MENIYRYFNCKIRQVLEKYEIKNKEMRNPQ